MIEVLLVSPRLPANDTRRCGDHTYTDLMLQHPPPGVQYHHYEDLIAAGQARRIRALQALSYYLTRAGFLPPDMWFETIATDFVPDIVHIYGFSAVVKLPQQANKIPVILGASTGSYSDLKYYHGWSEPAIRRARWLKRQFLRAVGAYDSSLSLEHADHVLTWSDFSRKMHLEEGYAQPDQISVLYPGLPYIKTKSMRARPRDRVTFLFVGRDFERKNGGLVVDAFRTVHAAYPRTRLILIGRPRNEYVIVEDGIAHRHFVPREELLHDVFPQADFLLLPSQAEGFGLVIVEAMSLGIPAIAVDAWAMPEIIQDGDNGFLIQLDSVDDLADRMLRAAAQPALVSTMQQRALDVFRRKFSIVAHNRQLRAFYATALSHRFQL